MNLDPFSDPFRNASGPSLKNLFNRRLPGGSPVRRPSQEEEPGQEDAAGENALSDASTEVDAGSPGDKSAQQKAILKNPKWEIEDVGFNEETDISVEAELPESEAHKTRVTFELFAKTPSGEESISKAEGNIADGKAVARIPVYIPHYKDEDGNLLPEVEY